VEACFATRPPTDDFETIVAYNAMVPPQVRRWILGGRAATRELLASLNVPVLFTHGTEDQIIAPAMSRFGAEIIPGARLSVYEGTGHSPFYEDAARFDRELAAFVRTCATGSVA
jgi:pimeloyl-ACP methyl ester carboxylesterase